MLKKIILILLICYYSSYSQNVIRFSKQYDFFDTNGSTSSYLSVNAFTVNNDYLLCGVVNTPSINQGLGIVRVDSVGIIKYQKHFNSPNNLRYSSNTSTQTYIKLKNNNLLFTGQYELGLDHTSACMVRVNHITGDTVWTKMYKQPGDTTYLLCSTELQDSSIISFGFRYITCYSCNNNSIPFMMKVDKNGNYKWHKYINTIWSSSNYLFQKIIKISDSDFITVGVKNNSTENGFIMRIDTNAVKQYEVNTNVLGFNNHDLTDFVQLQDGTYLACGGFYTTNGKWRKLLYNFNGNTGAKIKHKLYNGEANANRIITLIQKPSSDILLGGGTGAIVPINTINNKGDVLWVNSSLDSLKSIYFNTVNAADQASPNQLILTADGGFAACIPSYPNASQQKFWLVKADSNGCFTSTCAAVGLNELKIKDYELKIYPNPADDVLNVELLNLASTSSATEIQIINTLGQVVHQSAIKTVTLSEVEGQQSTIDIKDLPEGVYQLKISEGTKQRVLKFIKN